MRLIALPLVLFFHHFSGLVRGGITYIADQSTHTFVNTISTGVDVVELQIIRKKLKERIRLFTQRQAERLEALEPLSPMVLSRALLNCVREFVHEHGFDDIYTREGRVIVPAPRRPPNHPLANRVAKSLIESWTTEIEDFVLVKAASRFKVEIDVMCLQPKGCSVSRTMMTALTLFDSQRRAYIAFDIKRKFFFTEKELGARISQATGLEQLHLAANLPYVISKVVIHSLKHAGLVYEQAFDSIPAKTRVLRHNIVVAEGIIKTPNNVQMVVTSTATTISHR